MRADLHCLPASINLASTIREQESLIAERLGIPLYEVMELAGQRAFELLKRQWPQVNAITVLCGAGNNAGDGYVLARLARSAGIEVTLLQLPKTLKGDAKIAQQRWIDAGGVVTDINQSWPTTELYVDALLGTGFQGELRPELQQIIERLNATGRPILALDLPSGLNAETGAISSTAVHASHTITFVANKLGLVTARAVEVVGKLSLAPLQLGEHLPADGQLINPTLLSTLPQRKQGSHKGNHGRLLIIGGGNGMAGAVRLAGEAALRTGAGLVAVGCGQESVTPTVAARPELMVTAAADIIAERMEWADAIAIGTGLGQDDWARTLWQQALEKRKPMVVDADALNLLAQAPEQRENWVLTPHPGEAARLLGITVAEVEADRLAAAQRIQRQYGGIVVLKGAGTLIVSGSGWAVAPVGNPGLATGGSGDVLSGILAALVVQSLPLERAAQMAVLIHGEAADSAAQSGIRGMLPSDLFEHIRYWVNQGKL